MELKNGAMDHFYFPGRRIGATHTSDLVVHVPLKLSIAIQSHGTIPWCHKNIDQQPSPIAVNLPMQPLILVAVVLT